MGASGTHAHRDVSADGTAAGATLWLSFTDTALVGNGDATNYLWLDNYLYALTDPDFRAAFARTLYFTVVSVAIEGVIGVLVALLLNQKFVGRNILRVLVILPRRCRLSLTR